MAEVLRMRNKISKLVHDIGINDLLCTISKGQHIEQ